MPPESDRDTHFDLMLEAKGVLETWALAALPAVGRTTTAERLADHRVDYLTYEGAISGGRGCVMRVDEGVYERVEVTDASLVVKVLGQQLRGTLTLPLAAGDQRSCVSLSAD